MALIKCENVSFAYEGRTVVSDLTFEINIGDYLCIVGENGSGKSTMIAGLLGLKKTITGHITMSDGLSQTEIGYLPQQTNIQKDFPASVFEVVLSGSLNRGSLFPFYRKIDKKNALENMERLGITNLKNSCYKELSGGQQQRVLLARALCATGKILILDEPVTGLDPVISADFYQLIRMINQQMNITIVMVSHDIGRAVENATMILHMNQSPLFFGKTADYIKCKVGKAYIGGHGKCLNFSLNYSPIPLSLEQSSLVF